MKLIRVIIALLCLAALAPVVCAQSVGNQSLTIFTSAARTATANFDSTGNVGWKGIHVIINVSAYTSGNFTPHIQEKDPISGKYIDILVGTAISGTTSTPTVLKVYPGLTAATNLVANDVLPYTWRVSMVGASTPSATFSVSGFLEN